MKNEFRINITLGNAAMMNGGDVAHALDVVATKLRNGHEQGVIHDLNGNKVGDWYGEFAAEAEEQDEINRRNNN